MSDITRVGEADELKPKLRTNHRADHIDSPVRVFFSHEQLTGILVYLTQLRKRYGKILCQIENLLWLSSLWMW